MRCRRGGAHVILQLLLREPRRFGQEARLLERSLGHVDLPRDELDRRARVAARRVCAAQRFDRGCVRGHRVLGCLETLDGAVQVSALLEEFSRAHPLLGLGLGRARLLCEGLYRLHGHRRVARHRAKLGQRVERGRLIRIEREHLLVGHERARRGTDLLEQHFAEREQQIQLALVVARRA